MSHLKVEAHQERLPRKLGREGPKVSGYWLDIASLRLGKSSDPSTRRPANHCLVEETLPEINHQSEGLAK